MCCDVDRVNLRTMATFINEEDDTVFDLEKGPGWAKLLCSKLTNMFRGISNQIAAVETNCRDISNQLRDFKDEVQNEIKRVDLKATEALDAAKDNKVAIQRLEQQLVASNRRCNGLQEENRKLTARVDSQESYTRKENLVIRGIKDNGDETPEASIAAVRNVFIRDLKLDADVVNKMIFVRCHRLGKYAANDDGPKFHRSMIIRFMNYNDRQQVWNKRFDIGNKSISISENYANPVEMRRKLLYPVVKKAKSLEQYNKVFLRNDQLHIDNKTYSIQDNLHELPSDLHPRQFSYRTDDKWIVFGGIHSQFNFLSNYFEQTIKYKGIDHSTIEHAYQYEKSVRYNDVTTMEKILSAQTPAEAKLHGSRVSNFKRADWDSVKSALLEELLRIKFTPDSELARRLMATTGKSLAEAGKSKTFAIGLPLYQCTLGANKQFDTSKWSMNGNILGTGLMKIRNELNDL